MIGKLKTDFDYITDVFTGLDGGVSFVFAKLALEDLQIKCANSDMDACEILLVVHRFASILRVVQPNFKENNDTA